MIDLLLVTSLGVQNPHKTMDDRGAMVMGLEQEKTVHHFYRWIGLVREGKIIQFWSRSASKCAPAYSLVNAAACASQM